MLKLIGLSAMLLLSAAFAHAEDTHSHAHHDSSSPKLELDHGKKWATDEALRKGMSEIRKTVASEMKGIHSNTLDKATYPKLSEKISTEINGIFKSCKLTPKADAMLHIILMQIIEGAGVMKDEAFVDDRRAGAVKIMGALDEYGTYFDHPGWKNLERK